MANTYGANAQFGTGVSVGASNQYTATLVSMNKAIRCEFMAENSGGNGICVDGAQRYYDLVIERQ